MHTAIPSMARIPITRSITFILEFFFIIRFSFLSLFDFDTSVYSINYGYIVLLPFPAYLFDHDSFLPQISGNIQGSRFRQLVVIEFFADFTGIAGHFDFFALDAVYKLINLINFGITYLRSVQWEKDDVLFT